MPADDLSQAPLATTPTAPGAGESGAPPRRLWNAPVTRALIAANLLVFALQVMAAGRVDALYRMPTRTMLAFGACDAYAAVFDLRPETLLTSSFLHVSVLHVITNMVVLGLSGPRLERHVGSARIAAAYVVSALGASLGSVATSLWMRDDHVSAGASGAVCGVLGATLVVGLRLQGWHGAMVRASAPWLVFIAILGLRASALEIDNQAHLAGAGTGMLFGALWRRGVVIDARRTRGILAGCVIACAGAALVHQARAAIDPNTTRDATARYESAVAALSARRCDEARRDARAAEHLSPGSRELATLREAIARHCGEQPGAMGDAGGR